ncbi:MAG TPA: asparagine synthase (glutamine-hydrolyzing) [Syntrophorhabdales bacterium]|nr:asparagine synthase (glutamine-hydrolyzing) [Syntrophorhabdales bacterium]
MCGIAGYIGKKPLEKERILGTLKQMKNRGPDHQDFREFLTDNNYVTLLHSRLAIIDLDARSNQPFTIGDYTVVFNGEIYNYLELRAELEKCRVSFRTASDTEVLLQYYIRYGEECVKHFEGMWSFAIYDRKQRKLFLSRDRFAEKPLYFLQTSDGLYFGSEIKFIKTLSGRDLAVNTGHLLRYLVNGYKSLYKTEETFFKGLEEVRWATNMVVGTDLQPRTYRYWQPICLPSADMTLDEAIEGVRQHLVESMRLRLRSDVPLAFCLSGGLDSASIVSVAAKQLNYDVASFSIIEKDERYNEYPNIMATITDTDCAHWLIEVSDEGSLERLRRLIVYHDVPVATITYYVHSLLSEAISSAGYRVAFSGTSADELFTGYYDHFLLHLYEMRKHPDYERYLCDWQEGVARYVRNPILRDPDLYIINPTFRDHVYDNAREFQGYLRTDFNEEFTEMHFCDSLLRNRMMNELFCEATPVILHEDDLNSMYYSVENRSPYLDSRLFSFAYSIPSEFLIQKGYGKYILREAMKGVLNDQVRLDRKKTGFNASINSVVDLKNREVREYLLDEKADIFNLLRRDKVMELFSLDRAPNHYSKFLFSFMNARIFLELN